MNNFPNVLNIAQAKKHRSTFPLGFQHLTTMDFGKTSILHAMELMPNDEIDVNISSMIQLAPMVVPTMGEVNLYVRAFFVPFRFIWKDWEAFFSQFSHQVGSTTAIDKVPFIYDYTIWSLFEGSIGTDAPLLEEVALDASYDFLVSSLAAYRLTPLGRLYQQILQGLGYALYPCGVNGNNSTFSLLPLLSLAKIFRDYYVNPNYDYVTLDEYLNLHDWTFDATVENLMVILEFVSFGWYESDIFTSAWASPESVSYSSVYKQQTLSSSVDGFFPSGTNVVGPDNDELSFTTQSGYISERSLNILKQIYNFSLRQAVAGARFVDQLLSRFGISLSNNEARRAEFIGSAMFDTSISRVDATSSGVGGDQVTKLGEFVGRGTMSGNGHFHFKNDRNDFGMLIFVAHLMPRTNYYQGVKPHVNHINFNDFFNPDLEDIGNAPIRNNEVFADFFENFEESQMAIYLKGVFGFAPNYYDYKSQTSYLTGDFRCNSLNSQLKSFQLFREFKDPTHADTVAAEKPILSEGFQHLSEYTSNLYNRIFLNQNNEADHFIASFVFDVRATRDCNSLGNSLLAELNEHGNDVGALVKVRPNGKYF